MSIRAQGLSHVRTRSLQKTLVRWYARAKRPLPWRSTRDPYRIWVSEAMLQQTRVEAVIPFYLRFVARFPTVEALARARPEAVLAAWSGLGYYRRARTLQSAARRITADHGGELPSDRGSLLELPGIGPYTAGAIASIAFDRSEPLVDGNVARVLCRLFGLDGDPRSASVSRELWSLAGALVPARGAGTWNQALMELGALVCTPSDPRCDACPVAAMCAALRQDRVGVLPGRRARRPAIPVETVVLAVEREEGWLLERRPPIGRMPGMWQLPTFERSRRGTALAHGLLFPLRPARGLREEEALCEVRHTITHHRIRALVKRGRFIGPAPLPPLAWCRAQDLSRMALTGMTRKCLAAILAARRGKGGGSPSRSSHSPRVAPSNKRRRRD